MWRSTCIRGRYGLTHLYAALPAGRGATPSEPAALGGAASSTPPSAAHQACEPHPEPTSAPGTPGAASSFSTTRSGRPSRAADFAAFDGRARRRSRSTPSTISFSPRLRSPHRPRSMLIMHAYPEEEQSRGLRCIRSASRSLRRDHARPRRSPRVRLVPRCSTPGASWSYGDVSCVERGELLTRRRPSDGLTGPPGCTAWAQRARRCSRPAPSPTCRGPRHGARFTDRGTRSKPNQLAEGAPRPRQRGLRRP